MEDIKLIISQNIVSLRRRSGMTQIELAEKLNYSDKAISKWERGESVPDIAVLKNIADTFGVTVDYLITAEHGDDGGESGTEADRSVIAGIKRRRAMITGMSVLLVWVIAIFIFTVVNLVAPSLKGQWLTFIYAVSASEIVWLVFNSVWHNRRRNYLIISLLTWSVLASIYLTAMVFGKYPWQTFLVGIPGQLIIILWSVIGRKS